MSVVEYVDFPVKVDDPRYPLLSSAMLIPQTPMTDYVVPRVGLVEVYRLECYRFKIVCHTPIGYHNHDLFLLTVLTGLESHLENNPRETYILSLPETIEFARVYFTEWEADMLFYLGIRVE